MKEDMLKDFLEEECSESTRQTILKTIKNRRGQDYREEYNFNRFNLYLNFSDGTAVVEDELDFYETSEIKMTLDEFISILEQK